VNIPAHGTLTDYSGTVGDNGTRDAAQRPTFVIDRRDEKVQERLLALRGKHTASSDSDLGPEARLMLDRILSILRQTGEVRLWSVFRLHFQGNADGFNAACELVRAVPGVSVRDAADAAA
jgi:hypothetical protein